MVILQILAMAKIGDGDDEGSCGGGADTKRTREGRGGEERGTEQPNRELDAKERY